MSVNFDKVVNDSAIIFTHKQSKFTYCLIFSSQRKISVAFSIKYVFDINCCKFKNRERIVIVISTRLIQYVILSYYCYIFILYIFV